MMKTFSVTKVTVLLAGFMLGLCLVMNGMTGLCRGAESPPGAVLTDSTEVVRVAPVVKAFSIVLNEMEEAGVIHMKRGSLDWRFKASGKWYYFRYRDSNDFWRDDLPVRSYTTVPHVRSIMREILAVGMGKEYDKVHVVSPLFLFQMYWFDTKFAALEVAKDQTGDWHQAKFQYYD